MQLDRRSSFAARARAAFLGVALGAATLTASACGDDRGGDAPPPDPGRLVGPGGVPWTEEAAAFEDRVVALVNAERARGGDCRSAGTFPASGPLVMEDVLRDVARAHSLDMEARRYFDHNNPDGESPFDRIRDAGYSGGFPQGENIAAGQRTPEEVVAAWMSSDGHCSNILEPQYKEIGVGFVAGGRFGTLWTQVFGGGRR
jgi:uncharacterized protein YkwD